MISIYIDSQILLLEWLPFLKFPYKHQIHYDFQSYKNSADPFKLAFTMHRLHTDYDKDCLAYQNFEDKVIKLSEISNLVFTFESELHNYHWSIWKMCHRSNVYWCLPGAVNDCADMQDHIIHWGDWLKTTANLYRNLPEVLLQLNPYKTKPKFFDALLGSFKPHRSFVADSVLQNNLNDKFVMTYGGRWNNKKFYAEDYFIWEPDCEPVDTIIGTADWVKYRNQVCHLSQIIPISVYNDTAYSVVAETDHDNTLSFYSEKTAKVLIARRLFVAFSGYKFLHNLKNLGFQTFSNVIDESYDLIKHDRDRYTEACKQVQKLCNLPQQEVLQKVAPVLEHNQNLIMNTDWNKVSRDRIQNLILDEIK